jgi:predicted alpha/beta-fold hydrolase
VNAAAGIARYATPCTPAWWARGGHAQTIAAHLLPSEAPSLRERVGVERREIELADGDRLVVLGMRGVTGVRVHLFHGLSGDVDSDYMRRAAQRFVARGHSVWAVNHRGCGDGRGLAAKPYHSGRSDDLRAVLEASRADAPDALHVVIGYSMSGNIALLHASERDPIADAVIAVNPVVDLADASVRISRGLSRLYELRFIQRLLADLRDRQARGLIDRAFDVPRRATLEQFDNLVTAPLGGFRDAADYYARCSSLKRLPEVAIPTVVITSTDDPFLDVGRYSTVQPSGFVFVHVEPHGGHVGFLARGGVRWVDDALEHYLDELVKLARA